MKRLAFIIILLAVAAATGWFLFDSKPIRQFASNIQQNASSHRAADIRIETFTLSNGMEVVLLPNHRVPAVSHTLWLPVGAADDPVGKSGLAHFHEHMMFKGTPTTPSGEYSRRIQELGGELNAFTGADFTGYYVDIAKEHLELVMQLESDRMQHLAPSAQDYDKERQVVVEERQSRIGSNPAAQFAEQMQAAMFLHYPYRTPIIGWMHEIKDLQAQDAKAFYDRHYHAGNMILVVAGDITRAELEPLAEQYYGPIANRGKTVPERTAEPPHRAARRVQMSHPEVSQPRWQRRYLAPGYRYGDETKVLPLSLLAEWLGGGKTSLLYERLVKEQKLAVSASASYSGMHRGPAQFTISAVPAEGIEPEVLEAAIDSVLAETRQETIDPASLERIKTLFRASVIYARDGLKPLAQYAGYLRALDLPLEIMTEWETRIDRTSAADIKAAAQAVLRAETSVTGLLMPQDTQTGRGADVI